MKCPKCGYNSFDHLDSCKKCNKDLTEHKSRFSIQSVLLSEMPTEMISTMSEDVVATATASAAADIAFDDFSGGDSKDSVDDFGFDFLGDSADDENLAFDELFEEVPSEDDVEETLPAPETDKQPEEPVLTPTEGPPSPGAEESSSDDFSFDETELETASTEPADPTTEPADPTTEGSSEFGFDEDEDPAADIFAESEEDFSLDALDSENSKKK